MINYQTDQPTKVHFYAPDKNTHHFFEQTQEELIKRCSNHFTVWIVRTYLQVKKAGIDCGIVDVIPQQGIVIADRDTLGNNYPYLGKLMLVCAKGDREFHPSAHLHVVQNSVDARNIKNFLWKPHYIPHWPQPGLKPREEKRGPTVKTVAFMGTRTNLIEEFKSDKWSSALKKLGCEWTPMFSPTKWSDYSKIDVILAVRSFDGRTYLNKPASKLINAWKVGVPAILTPESAFVDLRKSELDFLIVNSIEEAISAVAKLKNSPELYTSMVNNGLKRVEEFSDEKITKYWLDFFYYHVFPEYANWIKASEASKILLFIKRYSRLKIDRMKNRYPLNMMG